MRQSHKHRPGHFPFAIGSTVQFVAEHLPRIPVSHIMNARARRLPSDDCAQAGITLDLFQTLNCTRNSRDHTSSIRDPQCTGAVCTTIHQRRSTKESRVSLQPLSSLALGAGARTIAKPLPAEEQLAQLFHLTEMPALTGTDDWPPHPPYIVAEAYAFCEQVIRQHSKSFFFSTQFLPADKRRSVRALYAFCRTTDDIVDNSHGDPARSLAEWVHQVRAPNPVPHDPVLVAWHDTRIQHQLQAELVDELLAGVAMDLTINRYATFADLWLYCYRVASVVGLLSMGITGASAGAVPYAIKLGVALQLTNILRDVGEDARRGRVYLPQEDLARFGLTADDILQQTYDERFQAMMQFQVERAHRLYDESWAGIALLEPDSRLGVAAAARIYQGILDSLVTNNYDAYTRRAYLTLRQKLLRLPRIWWDLHRLR
jgi:phytoene synthase